MSRGICTSPILRLHSLCGLTENILGLTKGGCLRMNASAASALVTLVNNIRARYLCCEPGNTLYISHFLIKLRLKAMH
jgi:hypothetical protein